MLLVIEQLFSTKEAAEILNQLNKAQWEEGVLSAGTIAGKVKSNLQLPQDSPLCKELGNLIVQRLSVHPQFIFAALPKQIFPPKFNCYGDGGYYGTHIDSAVMQLPNHNQSLRSDLSATLFLSSAQEYRGGELIIEGQFGAQEVKLNAGDLVLYPSSSLHQVAPVTQGQRVCSFFWIQSMVRSVQQRELLYDLDQSIQALRKTNLEENQVTEITRLSGIYHNLLRDWIDV